MMLEILTSVGSLWIVFVAVIVSILGAFFCKKFVDQASPGNDDMVRVQGYIKQGANAFLKRQYTTLGIFVIVVAVLLGLIYGLSDITHVATWLVVFAYIVGSGASAWAGWFGMRIGVDANAKTAWAANKEDTEKGLDDGFNVSFFGGCFMGLIVTAAALGGVWALFFFTGNPHAILGFSFGASSIALFAKAGGGIYTKTADVAADIVGKIEQSLPEDDPRNPAAIADNVGDNVGDIAGMGADLFDSYVASIFAAMLLGFAVFSSGVIPSNGHILSLSDGQLMAALPLIENGAGLFASIIGIYLVFRTATKDPSDALNNGTYLATVLFALIAAIISWGLAATNDEMAGQIWAAYWTSLLGLISGLVIGLTTDYYTDDRRKPVRAIAASSEQGHALNILTGFSYGLMSIGPPVIGIAISMYVAYEIQGIYGIAMASNGMLAIVATIVGNDAYGPIVDNARGIAEQGGLDEEVIRTCDRLDSAGNTAKAITKGLSIGAAALTVLALLYSYVEDAENQLFEKTGTLGSFVDEFNIIDNPLILIGLILGVMIPCVYSAILIFGVDKNAQIMVKEIRRQFKEDPGILKGESDADFNKCIDIATRGALKELTVPSLLSLISPVIVGVLFGIPTLGAFLAGSILSGFVFALLMSNAGGAWDNAKKFIEDGNYGGKGTLAHSASITGDTVGDPFKDTAGPSINTLICVLSLASEIFLPLFIAVNDGMGLIG